MVASQNKASPLAGTLPFQAGRLNTYSVGVCPEGAAPRKASEPFVQVSHKPLYGYNEVALDGKLLHAYGAHIRLLTKKQVRVNGKQVQCYTAKGLHVEVVFVPRPSIIWDALEVCRSRSTR
ncbi:hypothetical protein KD3_29180 [Yersinia pseudotuberculosis]